MSHRAYHGFMDEARPTDELAGLRQFLNKLESGDMSLRRKGVDVTQAEIAILKREIVHLEKIVARSGSPNA